MRRPRLVAVLLALVLVVTILAVDPAGTGPAKAALAAGSTTAATGVDDTQRPDLVSARLLARRSGHQVEVTGGARRGCRGGRTRMGR